MVEILPKSEAYYGCAGLKIEKNHQKFPNFWLHFDKLRGNQFHMIDVNADGLKILFCVLDVRYSYF